MVKKYLQSEILLELVLSVGNEVNEEIILKKCVPLYMRKLNCFLAGVLKWEGEGLKEIKLIPLMAGRTNDWLEVKSYFETKKNSEECSLISYVLKGFYYYAFCMDRDGMLILGRKKSFDETFSYELGPIINYLGKALVLADEIEQREKAEEALLIAKEKAEESDRLKSAFLANMSHEIRTPMNGILGFADLLKEPQLSGEVQQQYIDIIEGSGTRMLSIINDIISISKVESGQMELIISATNIFEQIEYIYSFFKPEAKKKGIRLSYKLQSSAREQMLETDREKVYAILTNLIKNAIKFTDQGIIDFGYEQQENELKFYVRDTGMGVPDDLKRIIFDRFRQGSELLTRNYEGAGLGLSITKAYVQMLGGHIWVEDNAQNDGVGSVFYFTLPGKSKIEKTGGLEKTAFAESDIDGKKKLKVLIVEDEEESELFLTILVKQFCSELLLVRNGREAVDACRNNADINLVLMDIKMPEMDGYQATKQIRQFNKDVIIISQTAFGLAGDREKSIASGCNDYISKPINKDDFIQLVRKYFDL